MLVPGEHTPKPMRLDGIGSIEPTEELARMHRDGSSPLVFAMTGAIGLNGGIARANLNILHAMLDLSLATGRALRVISLHDEVRHRPAFLPPDASFQACRGRKLLFAASLWRAYRRNAFYLFDHVHLALPLSPLMLAGLIRVAIFAHGSESWRRVRATSRWLYRAADLCLTNSRYTLSRMQATFDGFRGCDCMLGLPPSAEAQNAVSRPGDSPPCMPAVDGKSRELGQQMLLLVGRMDAREREKGHYPLLDVWPRIVASYPRAQLVFAGPGDDRSRICARARELGVSGSVFVPGFLTDEDLHALYACCQAFIMPSRQEGFGLVYLEAMSHAKACVGCRGDGAEDVIIHGETGYLLDDPRDQAALHAVIGRLFDEPEMTRALGQQGRLRVRSIFSSEKAQARIRDNIAPILCSR